MRVLVLLGRQQLGLDVVRQRQMLGADRARIAARQVDLAGVGEDVFARQLGGVRVLGVFVDDGGVAGGDRAVRRDQHFKTGFVDLIAVVQAVEVPHHANLHFPFLQRCDHRIAQAQTAGLGQLAEEFQARLEVFSLPPMA